MKNKMEEKIIVSIVIPAYNVENEISACLESVLAQSLKEIEIIVIDDGSTDNTSKILDYYENLSDGKIMVLHKENEGVTIARLVGVEKARGEWIGFVDGDDEIEPDMYEFLLKNAQKYHADISHCGYQMVFSDGRVNYFHNTGRLAEQDRLTGLKDLLDGSLVEPGLCNKLFHKSLFHSLLHNGLMDTSVKVNEDLLMNYILFSNAEKSVFEDACKYHYLVRNTSVSRAGLNYNRIYDPIHVKQIIVDIAEPEMQKAASKAFIGTCVNVYNSLILDKSHDFEKDRKDVWCIIERHKSLINLLSRKQQLLARMILSFPSSYAYIYRFYSKHFLKNRYE